MLVQILVGTGLIATTTTVSAVLVAAAIAAMGRARHLLRATYRSVLLALMAVTIWLVLVLTVVLWIWALAFYALGAFETLDECLYFAMVTFTTLSEGSRPLPDEWRLLTGFIAGNGFMLFGLFAAFLFEAMRRIRETHNHLRAGRRRS